MKCNFCHKLNATGSPKIYFVSRIIIGLALGIILSGCRQASEDANSNAGGTEATQTSGTVVTHNREISIQDLKNQWLIVNFWAEWCGPCRAEIPELNKLNERSDVQVLGVDFDQHPSDTLPSLVEKMNIKFPVMLNKEIGGLQLEWPNVLPVTYVIHQQELLATLEGPQTLESLTELLSALVTAGEDGSVSEGYDSEN